jgi:hypothetical protein
MATAALFKPAQAKLDALNAYIDKVLNEPVSNTPLKATLIAEALQKYGISAAQAAESRGLTLDTVNAFLSGQIDPSMTVDFHGTPYREIDRAKVERQIRLVKQATNVVFSGGMSDDWYTRDMAQKLAIRGLSDLQNFAASHAETVLPAQTIVKPSGDNFVYVQSDYDGNTINTFPIDRENVESVLISGSWDTGSDIEHRTNKPITLDMGIQYYYNKANNQRYPGSGDYFESAFEGNGGVYYVVHFTQSGLPVFATRWVNTSDLADIFPVLVIAFMAFGVPMLLGETILGAVGVTASNAVTATVGNIAINTALTGGDVAYAVSKGAASLAGGAIGGQIGVTLDSAAIGKAAELATSAALQGKQIDTFTLAAALATESTTSTKMDEFEFDTTGLDVGATDYTYDAYAYAPDVGEYDFTLSDIGVDIDAITLDESLSANEWPVYDFTAANIDDVGNVYDFTGDMTAMTAEAYMNSFYADAEGIKDGYNNVVVTADQMQTMTDEEVAQEMQRYINRQSDAEVSTSARTDNTPANNPAVANTAKMPSVSQVANSATGWDKLLKTAVSIGASVKAITSGTFRPNYSTSVYGTPRAAVGVPVMRADGSTVTNNGNGTQTIQYPDGRVQTVSTAYTGAGVLGGLFAGINTQTLMVGGGVLLAALLLAKRK